MEIKTKLLELINQQKESLIKLAQIYCFYNGDGWVVCNETYTFVPMEDGVKNTNLAVKTLNPMVFKSKHEAKKIKEQYNVYYVNGSNESIELEVNSLKNWYFDEVRKINEVIQLLNKKLNELTK